MKNKRSYLSILTALVFTTALVQGQQQTFYNVTAGNGNGIRFWSGNEKYKIHMGNASEYWYGPVQDYSIKTNMSAGTPDRGWTWGVIGEKPIAGLNSVGDFQIAGSFYSLDRLGIGTVTPNSLLHVSSQTGQTESLARFQVSDAPSDYFLIHNATLSPNQFIPRISGYRETDNRYSISISGATSDANDNGSNALVNFDARRSNGPIQTRPLFVWTSYTDKMMTMLANGNLGIGTTAPDAKLTVKGQIHALEVKVDLDGALAPDYVFYEDYDLRSLDEVQEHIQEHGHLPNIPSAAEIEKDGLHLKEMNLKLLEKVEELTLYTIAQQKAIAELKNELRKIEGVHAEIQELKKALRTSIEPQKHTSHE